MNQLDIFKKKIDDQNKILRVYSKLFQELHPNEYFLYSLSPNGMVSHFGNLYRNGFLFHCLYGNQVKTYFYYEEELQHKLRCKLKKYSFQDYQDVKFKF